jgi:catalase
MLRHPESGAAMRAFGRAKPPASYATTAFHGIHAFWLVNGDGDRTAFRFRLEPEAGEAAMNENGASSEPPQFLVSELEQRIVSEPACFSLVFQLADAKDPTNDPTKRWPSERRELVAGRLEVTDVAPNGQAPDPSAFDPTRVPDGVELSDDPVLLFRGEVYRLSAERRRSGP